MTTEINPFRFTALSGAAVVLACFSLLNSGVQAADFLWTGNAGGGNFQYSTAANWVGGVAPAFDWAPVPVFGSDVVNGTVDMGVSYVAGSVVVASGATQDITFNGPGELILGLTGGTSDATIHLAATGKNLTFNSPVGTAWSAITWDIGAGRTLTINGGLRGNTWIPETPCDIVKNGDGTTVLASALTNIGAAYVNGGTLELNNAGGIIYSGGNISINNGCLKIRGSGQYWFDGKTVAFGAGGGTFDTGTGLDIVSSAYPGGGSGFIFTTTAGTTSTIIGSSGINANGNTQTFDVASTSNLNLTTFVWNSGSIIKKGGGTLTMSGTNTYTGDTTVSGGSLVVNGSSLADTGKLSINGGTVNLNGAEIVKTLFFGSVQQFAGIYSANVAGGTIASANFTGSGTLIVTSCSVGSFESPSLAVGSFSYGTPGTGWTLAGGAGVSSNGSGFTVSNPNAPEGTQVLFFQGSATASKTVSIPAGQAGTYRIKLKAAQRFGNNQTLRITLNGTQIDSITPPNQFYVDYTTRDVYLPAGNPTLLLEGTNPLGGENTILIDDLNIVRVSDPQLWSDPATWGGTVPAAGDHVDIPAGKIVVLDQNIVADSIIVRGTLRFDPTKDLTVTACSLIAEGKARLATDPKPEGRIEIGTEQTPFTKRVLITLTGGVCTNISHCSCAATGHEMTDGNVMSSINGGVLDIHGTAAVGIGWNKLSATIQPGATSINLASPVNWPVGAQILITSSTTDPFQGETCTIASVTNGGLTVNLVAGVTNMHTGVQQSYTRTGGGRTWNLDLRAEVGLLTRNVTVQGDAASVTTGFGGHVMIMKSGSTLAGAADFIPGGRGYVENAEFYRMGRKTVVGKYPLHFHMLGEEGKGQYFKNNSIHDSYNRAIVIHGTESTLVENNFCYDHIGHGLMLEDGSERYNRITKNVVALTRRPLFDPQLQIDERVTPSDNDGSPRLQASLPASYWISNPNNIVDDNVSAGTEGTGMWLLFPRTVVGLSYNDPRFVDQKPSYEPLGSMQRNVTHSSFCGLQTMGGLSQDHNLIGNLGTQYAAGMVIKDMTLYANALGTYGGLTDYSNPSLITHRGFVFADCYMGIMQANNSLTEDSLAVADAGLGLLNVNTPTVQAAIGAGGGASRTFELSYDGPARVKDCHLVGYDAANTAMISLVGGSFKRANAPFSGMTYSPAGPPRIDLTDVWEHPRVWGAVFRDLDGTTTGQANTSIITKHPFVRTPGDYQFPNWTNAYRSIRKFAYTTINCDYPNIYVPMTVIREKAGEAPVSFYYSLDYSVQVELPLIVNEDYFYTYQFDKAPAVNDPMTFSIGNADPGDFVRLRIRDFGKVPGVSLNAGTRVYSRAAVDNATSSAYFADTTTGDLWVKWFQQTSGAHESTFFYVSYPNSYTPTVFDTDGDGTGDIAERNAGRDPYSANDLANNFNTDNDLEGWVPNGMQAYVVNGGSLLSRTAGLGNLTRDGLSFNGSLVSSLRVRYQAESAGTLRLYWATSDNNSFSEARAVNASTSYIPGSGFVTTRFDLTGNPEWVGKTITALRLVTIGAPGSHTWIDYIRNEAPPALWLDASKLTGLSNGATVTTWTDVSGNGRNATASGSGATYHTGALNGQPVVRFNADGNSSFDFPSDSAIRTVFWVVKNTKPGLHFLLGDGRAYDFHAGDSTIWAPYANPSIVNGTTKFKGAVVDGTRTTLPSSSYTLLSLVTTGPVRADSLSRDRGIGGRSWAGDVAELIIYDRALAAEEETAVGTYLANKYNLATAYTSSTLFIGSTGDHNYNTGGNWLGGTAPADDWASVPTFGSDVVNGTVNVPVSRLAGSVVVASGCTTDITFTGSKLILGKLGGTSDATVHLAADGSNLTFNSPIGNAGWDGLLTFDVGAGRTLTINGGIIGNDFGGQVGGSVVKTGAGQAVITSGSGGSIASTIINAGTLTYTNATAVGGAGSITVNGAYGFGGHLNLAPGTDGGTISNPISIIGGDYDWNMQVSVPNNLTFTGPINVSGAALIVATGANSTLNFTNAFHGTEILTFAALSGGKNFVVLSGASDFTGDLSVVNWNGSPQVTLSGGDNRLPTTTAVRLAGSAGSPSALDLNGNNQTIAGLGEPGWGGMDAGARNVVNTSVTPVTLTLNTTADQSSGVSVGGTDINGTVGNKLSLVKTGNATQRLTGPNTYTGATTINAGTLEIGGAGTLGGGSYAGSITNNGTFVHSSSADQTLADMNGGGSITKSGASTLTLSAFSIGYGGTITVNQGTVQAPNGSWLLNNVNIMINSGGTFTTSADTVYMNSLTLNGGTLSSRGVNDPGTWGNVMLQDGQQVTAGGAAVSIISANLKLFNTNFAVGAGSALNITSMVSESPWTGGPTGLTKTGAGTLTLVATNIYRGDTTITGGTLSLGQVNSSNESSTVSIAATAGAKLNLAFSGIDTVGKLYISGVQQPAGNYTSANASGAFTGGGTLRVTSGPAGYASWKAVNAPTGTASDDYDGDGVTNAVEYILGGTKDTKDLSKLPAVSTSGANLVLTFQRAQASIDGSTTVTIQVGTSLSFWPDSYNVPGTAQANNPGVTVVKDTSLGFDTVTLTVPRGSDGKKFARLVVTPAP